MTKLNIPNFTQNKLIAVAEIQRTISCENVPVKTVPVEDLLRGADHLFIEHAGRRYCLRLTRTGKLILTA